jgi:hypothetical protein
MKNPFKSGREGLRSSFLGRPCATFLVLALVVAASPAFAQSKPIPQLVRNGGKFALLVDGKPFIVMGGQVGNFSAYPDEMERAWPKFRAMNANTVEYPVYWNVIEAEEGKFDFTAFDRILRGARAQGLRVVLLWFGTWKNGAMDWSPNWVKSNPARFPRVLDYGGKPIRVLSPHAKTTLEADKRAYLAMMKHLREMDEAERTVIMVQVENEPGSLGSARDYSAEATKLFNGPVPTALVTALKKQSGTWKEVFGRVAEEAFNAYYVSSFINEIARAGKEIYPLPTLVNVWNGGYGSNDNFDLFDRPGETYPSGGAVSHMLDLWKAIAPDINAIASDIYHQSPMNYRMILDRYTRPDNPLLIVETGRAIAARFFFYALADYSAIAFAPFGVDGGGAGAELRPDMEAVGADFRLVGSAIPIVTELQGTPRLKAAVEEDGIRARNLIFSNYDLLVRFRPAARQPAGAPPSAATSNPSDPTGRALIAELGGDEFLLLGFDSAVAFRPVQGSDYTAAQLLKVEEGYYENGVWKTTRARPTSQGDYSPATVNLPAQGASIRVTLMRY